MERIMSRINVICAAAALAVLVCTAPAVAATHATQPSAASSVSTAPSATAECLQKVDNHVVAPAPEIYSGAGGTPPVLAYYYQWFDPSSWDNKKDSPLLGKYSSDDMGAMCAHVLLAKGAGIDAFLVSWKVQGPNNRRLEALMQVAQAEGFKLGIVYQGLDHSRSPLDVGRIVGDLKEFESNYAGNPVFHIFGNKPLVIWSGTRSFATGDIERVTSPLRLSLTFLGYAQSPGEYERIAPFFDGDAYYWSSGDPLKTPGYAGRLKSMGAAVHRHSGIWVAPFAPGFDARQVCYPQPNGGSRKCGSINVERRNGATLRAGFEAARASSPDALGIISWNEWSERTNIEPSSEDGLRYLEVLRRLIGVNPQPSAAEVELAKQASIDLSSYDSESPPGRSYGGVIAVGVGLAVVLAFVIALRRQRLRHARKGGDER
jgi:hypothetical protein